MRQGEPQLVAPSEYGTLLMEALDGIEYEPTSLALPSGLEDMGVELMNVQKRTRSEFDETQETYWTIMDMSGRVQKLGSNMIARLVSLQKEDATGFVELVLFGQMQKVSAIRADHELSPDFSPKDEFIKGLKVLAGNRD